jgi:DNA-binding beta-propeller fold protein YncE
VLATLVVVTAAGIWRLASGGSGANPAPTGQSPTTPAAAVPKPATTQTVTAKKRTVVRLVASPAGTLPSPVQDAAAAPSGSGAGLLMGGLTTSDVSTANIVRVAMGSARRIGALPTALHDTAAVTLPGGTFLFGGGDGVGQHSEIVRVGADGRTAPAGRLPAPSSDQSAAAIGGTAYVVGGYDGAHWLDTIVAWKPGSPARVVAHLPSPLRYAAATAVGGKLVVAGGSRPDGSATDAVLVYTPGGRVIELGRLPAPTTHAAAATIGDTAYVIGGRGATAGTPTATIVAVDLAHRSLRAAGHLSQPLSDLAAVGLGDRILVAGGRSRAGTVSSVSALRPVTVKVRGASASARVPALLDASNVYAADGKNRLRGAARLALPRIYVPNSKADTLDVIDPSTFRIVGHYAVGGLPQHVVPAYDLKTLYVTNDTGNSLTTIDPRTGKPGRVIPVDDPYNMYFTPDGRFAIVVAEALHRLDFRDAHTFRLRRSVPVGCSGIDHIDYSADGSYLIASCEFSGQLVKVDVQRQRVVGTLTLAVGAMPQDVKLSPDGRVFYVADMMANGVWKVDGRRLKVIGFLPTGRGAHGLYPSRDAKDLYVSNRSAGTISVVSFATGKVVATWRIPGGSPDMGGVSADGNTLWLSGRYNGEVYAIDTRTGRLIRRISVGAGPHGLAVWPQPGRYSLGHTGIMR